MSKKIDEYTKKFNKIINTMKIIGIAILILGILISIAKYTIDKSKNHVENSKISSENSDYEINLSDGDIIYSNILNIEFTIKKYESEKKYNIRINVNDVRKIEKDNIKNVSNFNVEFDYEGKQKIEIALYKEQEQVYIKTMYVYSINPYQRNFLDEFAKGGVVTHFRNLNMEDYEKTLPLLGRLGNRYIRDDFYFYALYNKNKDTYNFEKYDKWVEEVEKYNINIIAILTTSMSQLTGNDKKINTDEEINKFLEISLKIAERYPKIKNFEILNEPNYATDENYAYMSDEDIKWYSKLVTEVSKNLKGIDKKNNILSASTATALENGKTYIASKEFLEKMSNEAYWHSTGYSYHPYDIYKNKEQNGLLNRKLNVHNNVFNEMGGFHYKYITEYGISNYDDSEISENEQADKIIQQTTILENSNAQILVVYNSWDTGNNKNNKEQNYGLLYNNYTPKPSYYAMKNYYQNTNGAEYIGSLNLTNGLEAHTYDKDGHPLIIAWSNNTDNTYNFTLNNMTAKDIYGKDIQPDSNGQIQITTSPVYLYNVPTNYFYQAISNTATTKYNEFTENYAEQISKVQGLQSTINTLNQRMKDLSSTSNLDETTSINLMKQHFNLGNTLIQAYKSGALQIEYVKLSSMLDALNDIGNSFEDLVTVSAKTRNVNISETLDAINKADNIINDNDIEMIYPSKILQFSQDFYDKASYINGLEEENDIKTGLIVSKNLHSKLLADWATQFANLYIDTYIKNNPVTIDYSSTNPTNQNVTATLRTNAQITINNNSNSKAYTFIQNGTFTFDYTIKGQTFQQTATVNNIDKTAPTIEKVENDRLYLSEVTPKVTDENLKEVQLFKDGNQAQNYNINTTISEDGHYKLTAVDTAGNQTTVEFDISRTPAIIDYSELNLTNQDVTAWVNSNFDVNVKNNSNQKTYTFKENGEFTFELNIKGAELNLTAKVNNIDKTPPTITDVEDGKQYIDKVTPKIFDDNLNEVKLYFDSVEVQGYNPNSEITGEGFYKLVATDKAGNETAVEFTIIENPDEKYQIKNNNIFNIKNNTNQDTFRKNLKLSEEYNIYRNNTELQEDDKIATGDKLKTATGKEYILIVNGDINNDGDVNIKDIIRLRKYLLERNNLDNNSLLAADCNLDGKDISIKDLIRMRLIALERDVN